MRNVGRKLAFVLASTNQGAMIVNRFDYRMAAPSSGIGVGFQLLEQGAFDPVEVELAVQLLETRRRHHGDSAVAIDCGANIGAHTIEWAIAMTGWGSVIAIEAQERIYYALAGNIALNNCFNAIALHAAVSAESGIMKIPSPNYFTASSFGSLELQQRDNNEFIGQAIDYSDANLVAVQKISLELARVDLIKLDIEGMEMEALEGGRHLIEKYRPVLLIEHIKAGREPAALVVARARLRGF
jgi:FkbM family methyltransferase